MQPSSSGVWWNGPLKSGNSITWLGRFFEMEVEEMCSIWANKNSNRQLLVFIGIYIVWRWIYVRESWIVGEFGFYFFCFLIKIRVQCHFWYEHSHEKYSLIIVCSWGILLSRELSRFQFVHSPSNINQVRLQLSARHTHSKKPSTKNSRISQTNVFQLNIQLLSRPSSRSDNGFLRLPSKMILSRNKQPITKCYVVAATPIGQTELANSNHRETKTRKMKTTKVSYFHHEKKGKKNCRLNVIATIQVIS